MDPLLVPSCLLVTRNSRNLEIFVYETYTTLVLGGLYNTHSRLFARFDKRTIPTAEPKILAHIS